jgi:hypothetical protein
VLIGLNSWLACKEKKMNSVWDSSSKTWIIHHEGSPKKYRLNLSWSLGVAALFEGGEIKQCRTEVCGGLILQNKLIIPHPLKQIGEFSIQSFPLVEL